ncbi:hypothetical protein KVR01_008594 [Diaporthe batatas]|uniref:uncharacterized protein n=1 Tax=Diaporthe batatas TaxID=748121 RepID=UPI001D039865|nr:uncharacterized protein KVR01_008594 [Diaporthe batatas]KAG8161607.1 hypothetical protein KVR01_008594 [Diaporthe batatas]
MDTHLSFEAPEASAHGPNRHFLPLLQRHGQVSEHPPQIMSDEAIGSASITQALPWDNGRRQGTQGVSNYLEEYREELIDLFWVQDLPLRKVQEIMKEEHGLDVTVKVYKSQFRRWGIRKNLRRQEALNIAAGNESAHIFWSDDRIDEYAARIDRHLRKYRRNKALSQARAGAVMTPSRRIRAPDTLEKIEAATYYLDAYAASHHNIFCTERFSTGPQDTFSALFIGGLARLSRNDPQNQAFKQINLAFEHLKELVSLNHPIVYLRLVATIAAFGQYPKSEVCKAVCRTLSDYLAKLSRIIYGGHHPLDHAWGESLFLSAAQGPDRFALGVLVKAVQRCWTSEPRVKTGAVDIARCVPSDARGLDEASLRDRLAVTASRPDLVSQAQETRLALAELLIMQVRVPEAMHFYAEAKDFQAADPVRRASKTFWIAELEWRGFDAQGSINTLKSALASDEVGEAGETDNLATETLKQQIKDVLCHRENLLSSRTSYVTGSILSH